MQSNESSNTLQRIKYKLNKQLSSNPFTHKLNNSYGFSNATKDFVETINNSKKTKKEIKESDIDVIKYELSKYNVCSQDIAKIVDQINGSTRGMGVMKFQDVLGVGSDSFESLRCLILGPSLSGKGYLLNELLCSMKQCYSCVMYICPESSYHNKTCAVMRKILEGTAIDCLWINSDKPQPELSKKGVSPKDIPKNKDGSCKEFYNNDTPIVIIFDDIYSTKKGSSWALKYLEDNIIKARHNLHSYFILFQNYSYISPVLWNNCNSLFIHKEFVLNRNDDIWKKIKQEPPSNLEIIKQDPELAYFYHLTDNELEPVIYRDYKNVSQVRKVISAHLPVALKSKKAKKIYTEKMQVLESLESEALSNEANKEPEAPKNTKGSGTFSYSVKDDAKTIENIKVNSTSNIFNRKPQNIYASIRKF